MKTNFLTYKSVLFCLLSFLLIFPDLVTGAEVNNKAISEEEERQRSELISYIAMVVGIIVVFALAWFTASSRKKADIPKPALVNPKHHVRQFHKRR